MGDKKRIKRILKLIKPNKKPLDCEGIPLNNKKGKVSF